MTFLTVGEIQAELIRVLGSAHGPRAVDGLKEDIREKTGKSIRGTDWADAIANEVRFGRIRNANERITLI